MIDRNYYELIKKEFEELLVNIGINEEIKWAKVNNFTLERYTEIINRLFHYVESNKIKIRIMFTDNKHKPLNLSLEQQNSQYHILYYHFIKHAFGFSTLISDYPIDLELYFDNMPDTIERNRRFKDFIYGIQFLPEFAESKIVINKDNIYEVCSRKHILLQCLDIVLGSIAFRLNQLHKEKPLGNRKRGNRTIAKEKLYKYINKKIRQIRPNFNIGISTGISQDLSEKFTLPYRHWVFVPREKETE